MRELVGAVDDEGLVEAEPEREPIRAEFGGPPEDGTPSYLRRQSEPG